MPCDIARDANGHVLNRQCWTIGNAPVVTLHLAHPGIVVNAINRPPSGFFFKHVMCPSGKAGVTLAQKATNRLTHRRGGQFAVKIQEAGQKPNANAWALAQPTDGAQKNANIVQFVNDLRGDTPAYQAFVAGPDAVQWGLIRTAVLQRWNTQPAQQGIPGALISWVNQAINANFGQGHAADVRAALQSHIDPVRMRAGMSWNDKYGDGAPPENTVLVLSDGKGAAAWQPNTVPPACQPIASITAGGRFSAALTGALGANNAFPVALDVVVDFQQPCVMQTSTATFSNTMHIRAFALTADAFDVYHFEP
jgi:hypothetical protein